MVSNRPTTSSSRRSTLRNNNMPTTPIKKAARPKRAISSKVSDTLKSPISPGSRVRRAQRDAPDLGTEMITIIIGGADSIPSCAFNAHKSLIMAISGFFAMSLSSNFLEVHTGIVTMPEEDPDVFAIFLQFLYFGRLFSKLEIENTDNDNDNSVPDLEWSRLPRLYTLGERIDSPKFRDAVVSGVIEKVLETGQMPIDWANYVYNHTVAACPLRRLIIDFHVFAHKGHLLKKGASPDTNDVSPEFLQEAIARIVDLGKDLFEDSEYPWVVNPCRYHEHGETFCDQD